MEEQDRRLREELTGIVKDLNRVQQGFSRLFAMLDEGRITPEEFRVENERRRAEQVALEQRRAQRQAELQQRSHRAGEFTAAMELLRDFDRLWGRMNMGERKELLRRIDPHMTLRKEQEVMVLTIRPGWTEPINVSFVRRMPRQAWARGPQAPLTRSQLSLLCAWQDGLDLHAIAHARDIGIGAVSQNMYRLQARLEVENLDDAVELVKDRLEKFRATVKTEGRFQKRPPADPTLLSEPLLAVLRLMAEGMTGQAIATALGKDKSTISRQMTAICNRLAAHGREDAVARGHELGLI